MATVTSRVWAICRTLLRANRVLLALLMAWPCLLTALVVGISHGHPDPDDVRAVFQQELAYGLVLVALGASVALGNELRAHRVWAVLSRAVSRTEYLLALYASAMVPFAGYVLVVFGNAAVVAMAYGVHPPRLGISLTAEILTGALVGSAGMLASVYLPQVFSSIATGLLLGAIFAAGHAGWGGLAIMQGQATGLIAGEILAATSLLTTLLLLAAAAGFVRRDLQA